MTFNYLINNIICDVSFFFLFYVLDSRFTFRSVDTWLRDILYTLGLIWGLPWSWTVCRAACRHSCRKRGSDQGPACRTLVRSSGTRRRCGPSGSKAGGAPRCWTTAISETGKIEQTLPSRSTSRSRTPRICTGKSD